VPGLVVARPLTDPVRVNVRADRRKEARMSAPTSKAPYWLEMGQPTETSTRRLGLKINEFTFSEYTVACHIDKVRGFTATVVRDFRLGDGHGPHTPRRYDLIVKDVHGATLVDVSALTLGKAERMASDVFAAKGLGPFGLRRGMGHDE
jgi:hypothetical protein